MTAARRLGSTLESLLLISVGAATVAVALGDRYAVLMNPKFRALTMVGGGIVVAMGLAGVWLAWFFLARVTLYEQAPTASIRADGVVLADFSAEAAGHIQVGQPAQVTVAQTGGGEVAVPTVVMDMTTRRDSDGVRVELYALGDTFPENPLHDGQQGRVKVEVERVSPAALVLQAAGQFWQSDRLAGQSSGPVDLGQANPLQQP